MRQCWGCLLSGVSPAGKPKGVLHTVGGYMIMAYTTTRYVFDLQPGDTWWCTADPGWITGVRLLPTLHRSTCLHCPFWRTHSRFLLIQYLAEFQRCCFATHSCLVRTTTGNLRPRRSANVLTCHLGRGTLSSRPMMSLVLVTIWLHLRLSSCLACAAHIPELWTTAMWGHQRHLRRRAVLPIPCPLLGDCRQIQGEQSLKRLNVAQVCHDSPG